MGEEEAALEVAHVVAIVLSLLEQLERGGVPALRVLRKFEENNHEKVDRLVDLRTMYSRRVRPAAGVRTCVRVCVCVCVRAHVCVHACIYVCVCARVSVCPHWVTPLACVRERVVTRGYMPAAGCGGARCAGRGRDRGGRGRAGPR